MICERGRDVLPASYLQLALRSVLVLFTDAGLIHHGASKTATQP
jgi:hypothetical protein